jgi:hypothetical protein
MVMQDVDLEAVSMNPSKHEINLIEIKFIHSRI